MAVNRKLIRINIKLAVVWLKVNESAFEEDLKYIHPTWKTTVMLLLSSKYIRVEDIFVKEYRTHWNNYTKLVPGYSWVLLVINNHVEF